MREALKSLVRAGAALGQFRDIDPELAVRVIVGPIMFEALWRNVLQGPPAISDPATFAQRLLDQVLTGLAAEKPA